ncbi:MAG: pyridoxal-phosphate dependent enzyme, partial [Ardenticatenia bacterium]
ISVGVPRDRLKALRAVRETDGAFVVVSDEEILAAMRDLARLTGVFAEPAAAAAVAGVRRALADGQVGRDERVVVVITGNGLKDIPAAMRAVEGEGKAVRLPPTMDALMAWLQNER